MFPAPATVGEAEEAELEDVPETPAALAEPVAEAAPLVTVAELAEAEAALLVA